MGQQKHRRKIPKRMSKIGGKVAADKVDKMNSVFKKIKWDSMVIKMAQAIAIEMEKDRWGDLPTQERSRYAAQAVIELIKSEMIS